MMWSPLMMTLALLGGQSAPAPGPVTTQMLSAPEKALRFDVVVPASVDDVWAALSTTAGLQTWLWKDVRVDLRPGGDWLVLFTPTATGGGSIVSFVPRQQLVVKALAPEQFPDVRRERTLATFSLERVTASSTRVTLLQTGWKSEPEWDAAYAYLAKGNAQLLEQLHRRFVSGPAEWPKGQ